MTDDRRRSDADPEADWILYEKDPATKIATLTLNRPDHLNAPTIGMRLRYADLLHQANIDDDVKVLVIRGAGDDFGTGQDLPEFMEAVRSEDGLLREVGLEDADVTYPPRRNFRHGATTTQWFTDPRGGCRTLQEFKKISHRRGQGLLLRLALLPSRRRRSRDRVRRRAVRPRRLPLRRARLPGCGGGPCRWGSGSSRRWCSPAGPSPRTEMAEVGFVNSVVPRDQLEAEVQKYALACAQNRSTDVDLHAEDVLRGHEAVPGRVHGEPAQRRARVDDGLRPARRRTSWSTDDAIDQGLSKAVKDFDSRFPPEWRLSKKGREATE